MAEQKTEAFGMSNVVSVLGDTVRATEKDDHALKLTCKLFNKSSKQNLYVKRI